MKVPFDIDETYEPRIGDKVEITYKDDTVATYVITEPEPSSPNYYGTTRGRMSHVPRYGGNEWHSFVLSGRVLYRAPEAFKVGNIVQGIDVFNLPNGTVLKRIDNPFSRPTKMLYRAVLVHGVLRRIDNNWTWNRLSGSDLPFEIEFIPEATDA